MIGDILNFVAQIANLLYKVLGFPTMASMIFAQSPTGVLVGGRGACTGSAANQLGALLRFGSCQWVSLLYVEQIFVIISWILIFGLIVFLAYRLQSASDPRSVAETSELAWRVVFVGLLVTMMPVVMSELLKIADAMAQSIGGWVPGAASMLGAGHLLGLAQVANTSPASAAVSGIIALVVAWLRLVVAVLMGERTLVLAALFIVSPIVAWSWAWNPRGTAWGLWLTEVVSLAFLPTSLAITAAAMAALFGGVVRTAEMPAWAEVVSMLMLLPTASLLRRLISGWFGLIGLHEDRNAQALAGNIFGGALRGSLYAVGGMTSAMFSRGGGGGGSGDFGGPSGSGGPVGAGGGQDARAGTGAAFGQGDGAPVAVNMKGPSVAGQSGMVAASGAYDGMPPPDLWEGMDAGTASAQMAGGLDAAPMSPGDRLRRSFAVGAGEGAEAGRQNIVTRGLGTAAGAVAGVAGGVMEGALSVRGLDQRGRIARQWAGAAKGTVQEIGGRIGAYRGANAAYRQELAAINGDKEPGQPGYTSLAQPEHDAGSLAAVATGHEGRTYGAMVRANPVDIRAIEEKRAKQRAAERKRRLEELDGIEWA